MPDYMIYLRNATESDMVLVMAWHSNPIIQAGFYTLGKSPRALSWVEHAQWFRKTTSSWKKFMVVLVEDEVERTIGLVRISGLEDFSPQVALTIGEISLWGKHYGRQALSLAMDWLRSKGKHHVHTSIPQTNIRALRLFEQCGFKRYGEARKGELWYQREI